MKKIKTILVDDEARGLSSLKKLTEMHCPEAEIVACCSSADEALEKISQLKPQLLILDIAMPGKNGFDMLNSLAAIDFEIIFVTAHNTYMVQAFQFSAVDYLLKPVDEEKLAEAVKRAARRIEEKSGGQQIKTLLHNIRQTDLVQKMKLCIPSLKGFQVVEVSNIVFCEASANYTNFHFTDKSVICASKPIHEYETLLADCHFIRIHKSFLINLEHVKEYIRGEGGSVLLSTGDEVEVSRRRKDLFISRMKEFYKF